MVACMLFACNHKYSNSDVEIIDINKCFNADQLDIIRTKYINEAFVVKLETNDNCLLGMGGKFFFSNNKIFIKQETIYIFDFDGHFINKLSIGNGPSEVSNIKAADFDEEKNELLVYQEPYIKFYSPDGVFLREQKIPYYFTSIKSVKDGYILQSDAGQMGYKKQSDATFLFVDKDFNIVFPRFDVVKRAAYYDIENIYHNYEKNITIIPRNNDTIYQLINNALVPIYYIDYSSDKFDNTITNINSYFKEMHLHYYWSKYLETSKHQFFSFTKNSNYYVLRDKSNGKLLAGSYYSINALFSIAADATYNDYFVSCRNYWDIDNEEYENLSIFSKEDVLKIRNLTEDDNPLLIFFKLKPFEDEE